MATVAFGIGHDVIAGLASGRDIVVATGARSSNSSVIEPRHRPVNSVVAAVALIAADDVIGWLARLHGTVVTLHASALRLAVVEPGNGIPGVRAVAVSAGVGGEHVIQGLAAAGDLRAATVTGEAIGGRALEATVHMTDFALHIFMKAAQFKPGGIVIEIGRLRGITEQRAAKQNATE